MPRNNIIKQINAIQKSIDSLEKAHRRWPSPTPPRIKDTPADRERPKDTPPPKDMEKGRRQRWPSSTPPRTTDTKAEREMPREEMPAPTPKRPYRPMEDAEEAIGKAEGDTAPATQSTRAFAESAARRNEAAEDRRMKEVPAEPVVQRKPPFKMEYLDEVELDLKGDEIPMDKDDYRNVEGTPQHVKSEAKAKREIATGKAKRQGPEGTRVPTGRPTSAPEQNFDMMRKSVENSLLKLMQYGGT